MQYSYINVSEYLYELFSTKRKAFRNSAYLYYMEMFIFNRVILMMKLLFEEGETAPPICTESRNMVETTILRVSIHDGVPVNLSRMHSVLETII